MIVLLDASVLGLVTNPRRSPAADACNVWLDDLLSHGVRVRVPEIADYEVRRDLVRLSRTPGLHRLDLLAVRIGYLRLNTAIMRQAANFWAEARRRGRPTADAAALDADVILAAQALHIADVSGDSVVVATTNIRHLAQFVDARRWQDIAVP